MPPETVQLHQRLVADPVMLCFAIFEAVDIYTIIKTTRLSETEAVSVTDWHRTESRPELETLNE